MDFALTEPQRELVTVARRYLARAYPADRILAMSDGDGIDVATWPELERLGWLDDDLGMVELGLLAQESGYALHPSPWLTTVALTGLSEPATLVTGDIMVDDTNGWLLSGGAVLVPDAGTARQFIVEAGNRSFLVDASKVTVRQCSSLDRLRRMYEVQLTQSPARPIDSAGPDRASVLLACEAVGVAARALDWAVGHAKTREQFGRPIGSFQAVAHQLAEGYIELELARSLALRAAWLVGDLAEPGERIPALACAVIAGRRAAVRCCELAIQALGGIGVSWEHPLHLWFRRALWLDSFALPDPHAAIAAAVLGGDTR